MRHLKTRIASVPEILRLVLFVALAYWGLSALLVATTPAGTTGTTGDIPAALVAYWIVALSSAAVLVCAVIHTRGAARAFWMMLGLGVVFRFAGNASLSGLQIFDLIPPLLAANDVAYAISYASFFAATLWLVATVARGIRLLATLDSLSVMFFTGLISSHFALGPTASGPTWESATSLLLARSGPVFDVGLLCLCLVAAGSAPGLARRAYPLAGAFAAFLVADGLYLGLGSQGGGEWPELFWGLGIAFIGVSALSLDANNEHKTRLTVSPRTVALFWFSPLSPAVQLAFLLVWGAIWPPLPPYVLLGGAVIALYLALRIALGTYASRRLRVQAEALAKTSERARISEDLHDNLKQCVHSVPAMLAAYRKTRESDPEAAEGILDRALQTSKEASYRISGPVRELQIGDAASTLDVHALLEESLEDMERSFGIEVERALHAPLDGLSTERIAASYRITSEALWNAARHSGATRIKVESRKVGSVFLLKIRDDGRGFEAESQALGMGIRLMRRRAEESGGKLDVISRPGSGTTVQVQFEDE